MREETCVFIREGTYQFDVTALSRARAMTIDAATTWGTLANSEEVCFNFSVSLLT
jgi:hypothetical protein